MSRASAHTDRAVLLEAQVADLDDDLQLGLRLPGLAALAGFRLTTTVITRATTPLAAGFALLASSRLGDGVLRVLLRGDNQGHETRCI